MSVRRCACAGQQQVRLLHQLLVVGPERERPSFDGSITETHLVPAQIDAAQPRFTLEALRFQARDLFLRAQVESLVLLHLTPNRLLAKALQMQWSQRKRHSQLEVWESNFWLDAASCTRKAKEHSPLVSNPSPACRHPHHPRRAPPKREATCVVSSALADSHLQALRQ